MRTRVEAALLLVLAVPLPGTGLPGIGLQDPDPAILVAALESEDPDSAAAARAALTGPLSPQVRLAAGELLLAGLGSRPPQARRRRAELVAELFEVPLLEGVLARLGDPDPGVRRVLLPLLARPLLGEHALGARVEALERLAREDPEPSLRGLALETLGALDCEPGVAALVRLIAALPAAEGQRAARALPDTGSSAAALRDLAMGGFDPDGRLRTPDGVLAAVLPAYGRRLGEAAGGVGPADTTPLVLGLRHPDPGVRRGAELAFQALIARLRELGEAERALDLLDALAERGLDPRVVHYHRARLAFFPGADPEAALGAARALRGGSDPAAAGARMALLAEGDGSRARLWLFRSLYLEGLAHLALGHGPQAAPPLARAAAVLDAALGERGDLADGLARWEHVDLLHQRGLVEVTRALAALAGGASPGDREVLEGLRRAHRLSLESQAQHALLAGEALAGWDALLDTDLSPYRLLFTGRAYPGIPMGRAVELQAALGQALASVAPREMPGFAPIPDLPPDLADPLADPLRFELLQEVALARLEGVAERIEGLSTRLAVRGGTGWELPEQELAELDALHMRRRALQDQVARAGREGGAGLLELRVPGSQALWLARDLRNEGRGPEARRVAQRMKADLERHGISSWWYYSGVERLVRADMVIGSCYTDEDEPLRAQEALEGALERLEGLERRLLEGGAGESQLAPFRALQATTLVSLAVNSNVKLARPEEAREYYERAYVLRQDDFMRVLLACYRARSGRDVEARALLREHRPGPQTWYNLACTYALLGETERALEFLEIELAENHPSEASRRKQQEWAARDPDLASLRDDPRFVELVGGR